MSTKDSTSNSAILAATGENAKAVSVQVGDLLAGKYQVEEILGQGGMGAVVAARHVVLKERVALKFLLPGAANRAEFGARFLREAQVAARLRNEHIVKVSDVGVLESGAPYMVMEYVAGRDLRRIMLEEGPLGVARAVEYIVQACEGIAEAHAIGVVHRDLKPSNFLVTRRRDGSELIKVLDFGISKANLVREDEIGELTGEGMLLGSPKYMSPEQLTSSSLVEPCSDVWSLATVFYEMLAGRPPFLGESQASTCMRVLGSDPPFSLREANPEVPEALEAAVFRALERDKSKRTADVGRFVEEILAATDGFVTASLGLSLERIRGTLAHSGDENNPTPASFEPITRSTLSSSASRILERTPHTGQSLAQDRAYSGRGLIYALGGVAAMLAIAVAVLLLGRPQTVGSVEPAGAVTLAAAPSTALLPAASSAAPLDVDAAPAASAPAPVDSAPAKAAPPPPKRTTSASKPSPTAQQVPVKGNPLEDRQ